MLVKLGPANGEGLVSSPTSLPRSICIDPSSAEREPSFKVYSGVNFYSSPSRSIPCKNIKANFVKADRSIWVLWMAPSPGPEHLEVSGTFNQMSDGSQSIRAAFSALKEDGLCLWLPLSNALFSLTWRSWFCVVVRSANLVINQPILKYGTRTRTGIS